MPLPDFFQNTRQAIALSHAALAMGGAPAPQPGKSLVFAMQHQKQSEWCWAAVSVSVSKFYNPASGFTQCKVVNAELRQTTCCQNGSTAKCDLPYFLDKALQ